MVGSWWRYFRSVVVRQSHGSHEDSKDGERRERTPKVRLTEDLHNLVKIFELSVKTKFALEQSRRKLANTAEEVGKLGAEVQAKEVMDGCEVVGKSKLV